MSIPKIGIQYNPVSQDIRVARLNKAGDRFLGDMEDCTQMALDAVGRLATHKHGGGLEFELADGRKMVIVVEDKP